MIEPWKQYKQQFTFHKPPQIKLFNKPLQNHNPAFLSLSFRGSLGYSNNLITKPKRSKKAPESANALRESAEDKRPATYGAILCIKANKEKYALVQGRYTGKWSFPKGHSNEEERPIECTLREVAEETGIDTLPEPTEYLKVGYGNYFVFNLAEPVALIPRDTNEIMDTKWVTLEEMERMPLNADASLYRKQLKRQSVS